MKVANLQKMGGFPAVATNRAGRRDFAKQVNMFNEIARRNAQRTESAKGKEMLIFRMRASQIERESKPVAVEMPKPSVFYPLKRVAVILLSVVGLAIAGEGMAQTYNTNPNDLLNPTKIRTAVNNYYSIPESKRHTSAPELFEVKHTFSMVIEGALDQRENNFDLSILNERMTERESLILQ